MKDIKHHHSNTVRIILLNGVSSSGKTSIAEELQKLLEPTYLHLALDLFIDMFPNDYDDLENEGMRAERRKNVLSVMNLCIVSLAKNGYNLILDHVLDDINSMSSMINQLSSFNVVSVGLTCSLTILEKRERARGNRKIGLARSQHDNVHLNKTYDFEVDTSFMSPNECAHKIIEHLNSSNSDRRSM